MFNKQPSDIYSQNFYSPSASPQKVPRQQQQRPLNLQQPPQLANIVEQQDMEGTFSTQQVVSIPSGAESMMNEQNQQLKVYLFNQNQASPSKQEMKQMFKNARKFVQRR